MFIKYLNFTVNILNTVKTAKAETQCTDKKSNLNGFARSRYNYMVFFKLRKAAFSV